MAGDWIKLEHVTLDKPEILELSELLTISQGDALLHCLRFWVWLDQQSRDGRRLGVSKSSLDGLMKCSGFSNALIHVHWLAELDGVLSIPNFDSHNGETAKKRALKNKRQEKWRLNGDDHVDGSVDTSASTTASTREEKSIKEAADAADVTIWELGVHFMSSKGVPEKQARAVLGMHYKANREKLAAVVGQMLQTKPIAPIDYLQRAMQPEKKKLAAG